MGNVSGSRVSVVVCAAAVLLLGSQAAVRASSARPARVLAQLIADIASCQVHPCLDDQSPDVRRTLGDRVVSDSFFEYSGLSIAYPGTGGRLEGVVEWDMDGSLSSIALIVVDFADSHEVLKEELERALRGCVLEGESGDDETTVEAEPPTTDWECDFEVDDDGEAGITLHEARETLIVEID